MMPRPPFIPQQAPMPQPPPQILRHPPPSPQPPVEIPPLPQVEERAVNVLELEEVPSPLEEKDSMLIKRARVHDTQEGRSEGSEEKKREKKTKAEHSKKPRKPRRNITLEDFPLGRSQEPYNIIEDVNAQGPKISWSQFLHLSPKMRRQWSKMVSTRKRTSKGVNLIRVNPTTDVVPIVQASIKGQEISKVYVDGGAQICSMSEKIMYKLGLEVSGPSAYKAKLANNSSVKCLGVIKGVRVTICGIEVEVNMYVIPSRGKGYPIILGRPWLIAIKADQRWGTGKLVLRPAQEGKSRRKAITYDLKQGKQLDIECETSVDEFSSSEWSSSASETNYSSEEISSLEVMGVVLQNSKPSRSLGNQDLEDHCLI